MISYVGFFLFISTVLFIAYYVDYNPFIRKIQNDIEEVDTSDIEISINELKNLNQYIDNGITNHPPV